MSYTYTFKSVCTVLCVLPRNGLILDYSIIKLTFTCNCQLNCVFIFVSVYFKIHLDLTCVDFFAARLHLESSGNA